MSPNGETRRWSNSPMLSAGRVLLVMAGVLVVVPLALVIGVQAQSSAIDPGVRGGGAGAGQPLPGLSSSQTTVFNKGKQNFIEVNGVTSIGPLGGATNQTGNFGLGPRFDSNQCNGCHDQPAVGGSSPLINGGLNANLLFGAPYNSDGAINDVPFFETYNGPTVVARLPMQLNNLSLMDGHVHQLFTITGRIDAGSCNIAQPNFPQAASDNDLINRNTTPTFGAGLLEIINDRDILSNQATQCASQATTGICGVPNYSSDGSIGRFGWKAQDRSALIFAAEAYNVEEGVTTEEFPNETDETSGCLLNALSEDHVDYNGTLPADRFSGDPDRFGNFMRMLAAPTPGPSNASTLNGAQQFHTVGCDNCHSSTGIAGSTFQFVTPTSYIASLSNQKVNIFSDVLIHHMGPCLADGVTQGSATGDMFRSAPLWGVGQRIFFMHDGRTTDIVQAIEDHFCNGDGTYPASEANTVIDNFNAATAKNQQDLVNFLRTL
ncbi:MAG TPA: di-heme oxidoredictase family protein [Terriglobia bacterium]|nr:di-heme oxidoredictase family protein [Terriglobia bacterium]